jgi:hypothetical protein
VQLKRHAGCRAGPYIEAGGFGAEGLLQVRRCRVRVDFRASLKVNSSFVFVRCIYTTAGTNNSIPKKVLTVTQAKRNHHQFTASPAEVIVRILILPQGTLSIFHLGCLTGIKSASRSHLSKQILASIPRTKDRKPGTFDMYPDKLRSPNHPCSSTYVTHISSFRKFQSEAGIKWGSFFCTSLGPIIDGF